MELRLYHSRKIMFVMVVIFMALTGCGDSDSYRLFVYPSRNDLTVHREFGPFDTVNEARDEADDQMSGYPNGDYEIGKNCERRSNTTLWVCEDTFR